MGRVESYPLLKLYFQYCYDFLDLEVGVFILVLYAKDWNRLHAYYFMLLTTAFLGFLIYYFFQQQDLPVIYIAIFLQHNNIL